MAVYQMSKPQPKPVQQLGGPSPAKPVNYSEASKPGYGTYTRPSEPAKPPGSMTELSAMNPTTRPMQQATPQPFQYQNTTGAPLSFQEQLRQQLNARGAQLPAPQPMQSQALDDSRFAAQRQQQLQEYSQEYSQAVGAMNQSAYGQKPPMQDYSKPAVLPNQMPPAQAGAEVGMVGQAQFGPPEQITPVPPTVGSGTPVGAGYGGFYGGGGGGVGLGGGGLADYLRQYVGIGQRFGR